MATQEGAPTPQTSRPVERGRMEVLKFAIKMVRDLLCISASVGIGMLCIIDTWDTIRGEYSSDIDTGIRIVVFIATIILFGMATTSFVVDLREYKGKEQ